MEYFGKNIILNFKNMDTSNSLENKFELNTEHPIFENLFSEIFSGCSGWSNVCALPKK